MHKGAKIVMQVHYNLIAASGPDRTRAELRIRPATTPLTRLQTQLIAAPVELPCPDGVAGRQCTRQQAFQDEIDKYGVQNAAIPTGSKLAPATRSHPASTVRFMAGKAGVTMAAAPNIRWPIVCA